MQSKAIFPPETIILTQLEIYERFAEKVNKVFLKMMSKPKEEILKSDPLMIETIGLLREFTTWYCKTTRAMYVQNKLKLPKRKGD